MPSGTGNVTDIYKKINHTRPGERGEAAIMLFLITQASGGITRNNCVAGSKQAKGVAGCFACLSTALAARTVGFGKSPKGLSNSSSSPDTLLDRRLGHKDL